MGSAKPGIFITIEGGEGVGKSSFAALLIEQLRTYLGSYQVIATREPGGTPVADALRQIFVRPPASDPLFPMTELLVVSAARAQHVQVKIKPALQRGDWVVCDRFYDSTRAYQGILGALARRQIDDIIVASVDNVHPHLTFLLDCPVDVSLKRLQQRHQANKDQSDISRFDLAGRESHERLREAFRHLAEETPERFLVINATNDSKTMVEEGMQALRVRGWLG